jgi:hypothetical protein
VEEEEHLRHKQEVKEIYVKRKETIERVLADAKEKPPTPSVQPQIVTDLSWYNCDFTNL